MAKRFYRHSVDIVVEIDSDLDVRLKHLAQKMGRPIGNLIDTAVQTGVYGHMKENLNLMERIYSTQASEPLS